ncbi:MAG: chemotaxis protein CheW [Acidobacteria bacterium]|nr:chemotaxis protein CheW [Acidobacteriota bacterium]
MSEQGRHFADSTDARTRAGQPRASEAETEAEQRRELILMSSGEHAFAVYADEADGVTRDLKPTPLPGAPRAVAGVVCVRGRMRIVLDPLALLSPTAEPDEREDAPVVEATATATPFIVTLRGDEQLALAVERVSTIVELPADVLRGDAQAMGGGLVVRGTLQHDGQHITLLDPSNMLEAAMRGTERRRQRLKAVNRES